MIHYEDPHYERLKIGQIYLLSHESPKYIRVRLKTGEIISCRLFIWENGGEPMDDGTLSEPCLTVRLKAGDIMGLDEEEIDEVLGYEED